MTPHADADADVDVDARASRSVQQRVRLAVVVLSALALVVTMWWLRAPDRAFEAGYGIEVKRAVGQRIWTVLEHGQTATPGTIDIADIEPDVTHDGAAVKVDYAICQLDPEALAADGVSSAGYGMLDRHTRHYCTRLVPAEGASMRLGNEPGQELLVGITTTRPGRSVIRGHRIEFSEGWRRGSADIQVSVVVKAR